MSLPTRHGLPHRKSSLCNALFQGEVTPVSDVHAGTREVRRFRLSGHGHSMVITDLPGVG
ncbi:TPA: GTPase, partial [Escherichia coli]